MSKKMISAFLALILIFSFLGTGLFSVSADDLSGDYTYVMKNDSLYITGYTGSSSVITIPATLNNIPVYGINEEAFLYKTFTSVTLSEGISFIGDFAFEGCRNLKSINLPSTLTHIGTLCFNLNVALESIHIPKSVDYIGRYVFRDCEALKTVTVDSANPNYQSINNVIYSKDGKTLVCYPSAIPATAYTVLEGTETIGKDAFVDCNLTSITFPDGLKTLSGNSFSEASQLTTIQLPESVENIGQQAFASCKALDQINIPAATESISDDAFSNCSKNLKIYGYRYSYAELYANNNNITFELVGSFQEDIDSVIQKIDTLQDIALENKPDVISARTAYDGLLYKTVKSYVSNYKDLLLAEKIISALENENPVPEFLLGDLNNDQQITVSDVITLRKIIMSGQYTNQEYWAGDLNVDNIISVSDVIALRMLIMKGTAS